ncbi:copper chaperone CopZ [Chitinophaga skermanii]|uniref:Copper chaperone CopZ n=1 Tax=Chitinophaga skermanii TaxID=331697 RepID=A0A327Q4R9_9BACT|nr:heavy-metal-associated domain-containing protein [Chitinophaga skermanii]RAI99419.1 copper chaperone CopZ [Chitinophaga skermanii]
MKLFTFIAAFVTLFTFSANAQYKKASLQASGLTCAMCSNATLKSLQTLPFVESIDTDLENTTFILNFKKDANVSIDEMRAKVEDAGFSVAKLVVTADFDNVKISNDAHINYNGNTLHFVSVKDQTLNGEKSFTVVDKDFIPAKSYKKYSEQTKMACIKTGFMQDCCHTPGTTNSKRVYHVTI